MLMAWLYVSNSCLYSSIDRSAHGEGKKEIVRNLLRKKKKKRSGEKKEAGVFVSAVFPSVCCFDLIKHYRPHWWKDFQSCSLKSMHRENSKCAPTVQKTSLLQATLKDNKPFVFSDFSGSFMFPHPQKDKGLCHKSIGSRQNLQSIDALHSLDVLGLTFVFWSLVLSPSHLYTHTDPTHTHTGGTIDTSVICAADKLGSWLWSWTKARAAWLL